MLTGTTQNVNKQCQTAWRQTGRGTFDSPGRHVHDDNLENMTCYDSYFREFRPEGVPAPWRGSLNAPRQSTSETWQLTTNIQGKASF